MRPRYARIVQHDVRAGVPAQRDDAVRKEVSPQRDRPRDVERAGGRTVAATSLAGAVSTSTLAAFPSRPRTPRRRSMTPNETMRVARRRQAVDARRCRHAHSATTIRRAPPRLATARLLRREDRSPPSRNLRGVRRSPCISAPYFQQRRFGVVASHRGPRKRDHRERERAAARIATRELPRLLRPRPCRRLASSWSAAGRRARLDGARRAGGMERELGRAGPSPRTRRGPPSRRRRRTTPCRPAPPRPLRPARAVRCPLAPVAGRTRLRPCEPYRRRPPRAHRGPQARQTARLNHTRLQLGADGSSTTCPGARASRPAPGPRVRPATRSPPRSSCHSVPDRPPPRWRPPGDRAPTQPESRVTNSSPTTHHPREADVHIAHCPCRRIIRAQAVDALGVAIHGCLFWPGNSTDTFLAESPRSHGSAGRITFVVGGAGGRADARAVMMCALVGRYRGARERRPAQSAELVHGSPTLVG